MNLRKFYPLLLLITGLVAYHNSFFGPFIFDDTNSVVENPSIRHLWPLRDPLFGSSHTAVGGRPTTCLTFALNYAMGGLDVRGYHLFNLCLHLLVSFVLYQVLTYTLRTAPHRGRFEKTAPDLALVIALIWVVHPVQTECVTYIVQRMELLVGLFYLSTIYCLIRSQNSPHPILWYSGAVVACGAGMGSKEVMATAPFVVFLYDRTFIAGSFRKAFRQRWGLYAGLLATLFVILGMDSPGLGTHASKGEVVWSAIRSLVHPEGQAFSASSGYQDSPWQYLLSESEVIVHYLQLCFWPKPLILDYYDWPYAKSIGEIWPSGGVIVMLLLITGWALVRRPVLGFCLAWFFLILSPTSSILPLHGELAADRRLYLPIMTIISLVVVCGWHYYEVSSARVLHLKLSFRNGLFFLTAAAVVGLSRLTIERNDDYSSEISIWEDTVEKRPKNSRAHSNLGAALQRQQKLDEAIIQFREAIRLESDFAPAHHGLGVALAKQDKLSEAMEHLLLAVQLDPSGADIHCSLGILLSKQGKMKEAMEHLNLSLRLNPNSPLVYNSLGIIQAKQGQLEAAIAQFHTALRLQPDLTEARENLEHVLTLQKQNKLVPDNPPLAPTP